ncbi:MAG TPA: hypothetical protein VH879_03020 [Gemmatimonadales bacterium]|jgi:hypothetical protein
MLPGPLRLVPYWYTAAGIGAAVGAAGCSTRDRLTFPDPGPAGPQTVIEQPAQDTSVSEGPAFVVSGRSRDADGVDTVYLETEGGVDTFLPLTDGGTDVPFDVPLTTVGQSGQTLTLRVFGTDGLGNRGDTAVRRIAVQ